MARKREAGSIIEVLQAMLIYGNAHHDRDLFDLAHQIAADESLPVADRYAALLKMDEAMGIEQPIATDEVAMLREVTQYIEETDVNRSPATEQVREHLMQQLDAQQNAIANLLGDDEE